MRLIKPKNQSVKPQVGQILYDRDVNETGQVVRECLFFIDSPIEDNKQWLITWIAQMEDYGKGLEVYTNPVAGGSPQKRVRVATDEDIRKFVDCIKQEKNGGVAKLKKWIEIINTSEDLQPMKTDEKKRLIRIITESINS